MTKSRIKSETHGNEGDEGKQSKTTETNIKTTVKGGTLFGLRFGLKRGDNININAPSPRSPSSGEGGASIVPIVGLVIFGAIVIVALLVKS
jgi:hypothetical protein